MLIRERLVCVWQALKGAGARGTGASSFLVGGSGASTLLGFQDVSQAAGGRKLGLPVSWLLLAQRKETTSHVELFLRCSGILGNIHRPPYVQKKKERK